MSRDELNDLADVKAAVTRIEAALIGDEELGQDGLVKSVKDQGRRLANLEEGYGKLGARVVDLELIESDPLKGFSAFFKRYRIGAAITGCTAIIFTTILTVIVTHWCDARFGADNTVNKIEINTSGHK